VKTIGDIIGYTPDIEYIEKSMGDPLRNDFNVEKAASYGFKAKVSLEDGLRMLVAEMI